MLTDVVNYCLVILFNETILSVRHLPSDSIGEQQDKKFTVNRKKRKLHIDIKMTKY